MSILIQGLAKSGTTALYHKIGSSFDRGIFLFEPKVNTVRGDETLVKNIITRIDLKGVMTPSLLSNEVMNRFNKRVFIIRDPRDIMISAFLYFTGYHLFQTLPIGKRQWILDKLREKEENSDSVSLKELFINTRDFFVKNQYELLFKTIHSCPHFLFKYEDMVDGNIEPLNDYLGLRIDPNANVDPSLNRVVRTKSYGNWRKWFTQEDVEILQNDVNVILEKMGYDIDWTLDPDRTIDKKVSSEYVIKLMNDKS